MRVGRNSTRIKAIPTIYNEVTFRSRLEARWAVFFDALGITYVYEPEAVTDTEHAYLPDFWIRCSDYAPCYVEIKPKWPSPAEIERLWPKWRLIPGVYDDVLVILCGPPALQANARTVFPEEAESPTFPQSVAEIDKGWGFNNTHAPFIIADAVLSALRWQPTRTPALSR